MIGTKPSACQGSFRPGAVDTRTDDMPSRRIPVSAQGVAL